MCSWTSAFYTEKSVVFYGQYDMKREECTKQKEWPMYAAKSVPDHLFTLASKVVGVFAEELVSTEEDIRTGGALAWCSGDQRCLEVLGTVSAQDAERFTTNAQNKNAAMVLHGVILSEKVADPTGEPPIYGGGIQLSDGSYLAFSGFPPAWDQAFCMMLAEYHQLITPQRRNSLIEQSASPVRARLLFRESSDFLNEYLKSIYLAWDDIRTRI